MMDIFYESNNSMYLDTLLLQASVGYGQLGTHGNLGYEGKSVLMKRQQYKHAFAVRAAVGAGKGRPTLLEQHTNVSSWQGEST